MRENTDQKNSEYGHFSRSVSLRYSILMFYVISAKYNKARVNSDYGNIFFIIYGLLKMLFYHFRMIDFSNFKLTFGNSLMKKTPFNGIFSKFIQRFTIRKNFTTRPLKYFCILQGIPFSLLLTISVATDTVQF